MVGAWVCVQSTKSITSFSHFCEPLTPLKVFAVVFLSQTGYHCLLLFLLSFKPYFSILFLYTVYSYRNSHLFSLIHFNFMQVFSLFQPVSQYYVLCMLEACPCLHWINLCSQLFTMVQPYPHKYSFYTFLSSSSSLPWLFPKHLLLGSPSEVNECCTAPFPLYMQRFSLPLSYPMAANIAAREYGWTDSSDSDISDDCLIKNSNSILCPVMKMKFRCDTRIHCWTWSRGRSHPARLREHVLLLSL